MWLAWNVATDTFYHLKRSVGKCFNEQLRILHSSYFQWIIQSKTSKQVLSTQCLYPIFIKISLILYYNRPCKNPKLTKLLFHKKVPLGDFFSYLLYIILKMGFKSFLLRFLLPNCFSSKCSVMIPVLFHCLEANNLLTQF